jgi:hypothetical protein
MVIQASLLAALQRQIRSASTFTSPVPPAGGKSSNSGLSRTAQDDWVTVKVCPATVSDPVRLADPVWVATEYSTWPLPGLPETELTWIQGSLLAAVHAQVCEVRILTRSVPPEGGKPWNGGASENSHADCVTVKVQKPMVIVPVRGVGPAWAATE